MVLKTNSENQQVGANSSVYHEELKGSIHEELEQKRKLKFEQKVQVQDIPLTGKKGRCEKAKVDMQYKRANTEQRDLRQAFKSKDLVLAKKLISEVENLNISYMV